MWLSSSEDCMIVVLSHFDMTLDSDRQMDRQMESFIANKLIQRSAVHSKLC